jgi:hypothetical protein
MVLSDPHLSRFVMSPSGNKNQAMIFLAPFSSRHCSWIFRPRLISSSDVDTPFEDPHVKPAFGDFHNAGEKNQGK